MASGAFGRPGPIAQGHVEQEFKVQRGPVIIQSKMSALSLPTFCLMFLRFLGHWNLSCMGLLSAGATSTHVTDMTHLSSQLGLRV